MDFDAYSNILIQGHAEKSGLLDYCQKNDVFLENVITLSKTTSIEHLKIFFRELQERGVCKGMNKYEIHAMNQKIIIV